jgi:hypothetical protein
MEIKQCKKTNCLIGKDLESKKLPENSYSKILSNKLKFIQESESFYKKLNHTQKEELQNYKFNGYLFMNEFLRNKGILKEIKLNILGSFNNVSSGLSLTVEKIPKFIEYKINKVINSIKLIDSIFNKQNIPKLEGSEILYRGIKGEFDTSKYKIGNEIEMESFLSCSFNSEVAERFASQFVTNTNYCCMFIIKDCKDLPYIYLQWGVSKNEKMTNENLIDYGDEFELVLPRGCKFEITDIYKYIPNNYKKTKQISTGNFMKLIKKKYGSQEITDEIYEKEMVTLYQQLIVIELKFINHNVSELPEYKYNSTVPLFYNDFKMK